MKTFAHVPLVLGFAIAVGCSSSSEKTSEPAVDSGGAEEAGGAVDVGDADAGEIPPAEPKAPTLDQLMKMSGALHVMWTNNQACDYVLLERKDDTNDWKQVFSVKGTYDNKMDGSATANTNYTYRLRCRVGDAMSAYSNELSKNPTK